ncbi:Hypothetical predicted protein [Pelobates cultripes]|uniref:Uncharacterized protein n=1 Tax=Pelobates cultripes TaxID=61616 RepID=A0AAD1WCX1_PELCU|nr:Hypothetical predicted protein [Pelobates cultripes]
MVVPLAPTLPQPTQQRSPPTQRGGTHKGVPKRKAPKQRKLRKLRKRQKKGVGDQRSVHSCCGAPGNYLHQATIPHLLEKPLQLSLCCLHYSPGSDILSLIVHAAHRRAANFLDCDVYPEGIG